MVAVAVVLLSAVGAASLARLSTAASGRARVEAAADLVALAAVSGGPDAGRRVAVANGAAVTRLDVDPVGAVVVEIRSDDGVARASAAAVGEPMTDPGRGAAPR